MTEQHPNLYRRFDPRKPLKGSSWNKRLKFFRTPYYKELIENLKGVDDEIYPHPYKVFEPLKMCPFEKVRVVFLYGEPLCYDGPTTGVPFSLRADRNKGKKPIYVEEFLRELKYDVGIVSPTNRGTLTDWLSNGVLLLHCTPTITKNKPQSHLKFGWGWMTYEIIRRLSEESERNLVFVLIGAQAWGFAPAIDSTYHHVIKLTIPTSRRRVGRGPYWKNGKHYFARSRIFSRISKVLKIEPRRLFNLR